MTNKKMDALSIMGAVKEAAGAASQLISLYSTMKGNHSKATLLHDKLSDIEQLLHEHVEQDQQQQHYQNQQQNQQQQQLRQQHSDENDNHFDDENNDGNNADNVNINHSKKQGGVPLLLTDLKAAIWNDADLLRRELHAVIETIHRRDVVNSVKHAISATDYDEEIMRARTQAERIQARLEAFAPITRAEQRICEKVTTIQHELNVMQLRQKPTYLSELELELQLRFGQLQHTVDSLMRMMLARYNEEEDDDDDDGDGDYDGDYDADGDGDGDDADNSDDDVGNMTDRHQYNKKNEKVATSITVRMRRQRNSSEQKVKEKAEMLGFFQ